MTKKWHLRGQIFRETNSKLHRFPEGFHNFAWSFSPPEIVQWLRFDLFHPIPVTLTKSATLPHVIWLPSSKKKCTSKHVFENPSRNQPLDLPLSTRALSLLPALSGWCLGVSHSIQTLNMVSRFPNIHWLPTKTIHFYSFDGSLWDIPIWRISSWQIF